ncbi:hypothetical protein BKA80DRAFT_253023 [Phyllosticta citrichinensis]
MTEYTTKWKETQRKNKSVSVLVWSAISLSICGFVLQVLGLRALHSSVSVAQLGVMVVMSAVRAGLRTRRMDIEDSPMSQDPEFYEGHELDWSEEQDTLLFLVAGFPKLGGIEIYKEPVHHDWQWGYDSQSMVEIQRVSIVNEAGELTVELLSGLIFNDSNKRDVHVGESERGRLVKDSRMDLQKTKELGWAIIGMPWNALFPYYIRANFCHRRECLALSDALENAAKWKETMKKRYTVCSGSTVNLYV